MENKADTWQASDEAGNPSTVHPTIVGYDTPNVLIVALMAYLNSAIISSS